MPLSEDEQRILHEIERSFYEHDPAFAKGVSETTLYRHAGRNAKWAFLGLTGGFILLVLSFASNRIIGFFAFLLMLMCALSLERNFRKMGRAGWAELTQTVRERGFPNVLGDTRNRLNKRFKRDDSS
ncbi:MAG TPA: DUF3040 domain-containing protein [Acidimicrobiales bacterium]|nr:DUF3040 domain-containing protein [Acidimicrobiales bacterium]